MSSNRNQRGLGRGLQALLADADLAHSTPPNATTERSTDVLPIEYLEANPNQPRKAFNADELQELSSSIRERGMIQPILVRRVGENRYQIVAGERRWRAAGLAQLHNVPVIIREYSDSEVAEIALIENIQRRDLNPMEEALAYQDLIDRYKNTQDEISRIIGKSRSHIANMLRLLRLDKSVQDLVRDGAISFGHARALVTSEIQIEDAKLVIGKEMSVRELEKMLEARRTPIREKSGAGRAASGRKDADTLQLEQELSAALGMSVSIDHNSDGDGRLSVGYHGLDELDRLCQLLGK